MESLDQEVLLETQNPRDVQPEDLQDLAEAIRSRLPGRPVRIVGEVSGLDGVTFWEVIYAWLPPGLPHDAVVATIGIIGKEAIAWARRRFKVSPGRPKYIAILGPEGELLKSFRVNGRWRGVTDMTAEDQGQQGPRRRPRREDSGDQPD